MTAETGVHALNARPGEAPVQSAIPYADTTTAMNAAIGVLAALHARDIHGVGQHVDIAMYATALANLSFKGYEYLASGANPSLNPRQSAGPRGEFDTADGAIYVTCHNDKVFRGLAEACGHPDWADDPRFSTLAGRYQHNHALLDAFRPVIASAPGKYWSERFKAIGVPCGVVCDPGQALTSDYASEQNLVYSLPHPTAGTVPGIASPYRLSETPGPVPTAAPLLGQHTAQVLHDLLGYGRDKIDALGRAGAIRIGEETR